MKTKTYYFFFFILLQLIQTNIFAQPLEFANAYQDPDGNQILFHMVKYHQASQSYFAVGQSNGQASVTKIDQFGQHLWTNIYGTNEITSEFTSLVFTPNNDQIMIAGRTNMFTNTSNFLTGDLFFQRISLSGNIIWDNSIDNVFEPSFSSNPLGRLLRVKIMNNGPWDNYWVTALVCHDADGNHDGLAVFSINNQGNLLSSRYFGGVCDDVQIYDAVGQVGGGSVFYCGNTVQLFLSDCNTPSQAPNLRSYIHRALPVSGGQNLNNTRFQFGESTGNRLVSINYTNDNSFLLSGGNSNQTSNDGLSTGDGIILRLNPDRSVRWQVATNDGIPFNSAIEMNDGSIVGIRVRAEYTDIIHLDENGMFLNAQRIDDIKSTRAIIRLEHTGDDANDRVIIYGANTSNDATLVIVNPVNFSCIGTEIFVDISPITIEVDTDELDTWIFGPGTLSREYNKNNLDFQELEYCCTAPIGCTAQTDTTACADEGNFGYIHLECNSDMTYDWSLPTDSGPFEVSCGTSSSILNAVEGTYSVTITDSDGCMEERAYEITADCCNNCPAPSDLHCKNTESMTKLAWQEIPDAIDYEVTIVYNNNDCGCTGQVNAIEVTNTQGNYYLWKSVGPASCFSWSVKALCSDSNWSEPSPLMCYSFGEGCSEAQLIIDHEAKLDKPDINPHIYPNPSKDILNLELITPPDLILSIDIYSLDGKLVKSFAEESYSDGVYKKNWSIDSSIPDGLYYVFFKTNFGKFQKKVVISKDINQKN